MTLTAMGHPDIEGLDWERRARLEKLLAADPKEPDNVPYYVCAVAIVLANVLVMAMLYHSLSNQALMISNQRDGALRGQAILNQQNLMNDGIKFVSAILRSRAECR